MGGRACVRMLLLRAEGKAQSLSCEYNLVREWAARPAMMHSSQRLDAVASVQIASKQSRLPRQFSCLKCRGCRHVKLVWSEMGAACEGQEKGKIIHLLPPPSGMSDV